VVREALGYAEPGPEDRVREDELSVVPAIELWLANGFRPVVVERWLRVYADSLRRIAETETDWYNTEVVQPMLASGMNEGQMLEAQGDFGSARRPAPVFRGRAGARAGRRLLLDGRSESRHDSSRTHTVHAVPNPPAI
jgi:hypothetical protein